MLSEREANGDGLYASATAIPDASPPKETNPQLLNDGKPGSLSSASYRRAYFGPPGSDVTYTVPYLGKMEVYGAGCLARATAQLSGSMYGGLLTQQLNDIADASWAHFTRRAAFVTAAEAWSACMKAHAYDVERPKAPGPLSRPVTTVTVRVCIWKRRASQRPSRTTTAPWRLDSPRSSMHH